MNQNLKVEVGKDFGDVPVLPLGKMDLAVADLFLPVQPGLLHTAGIAFVHASRVKDRKRGIGSSISSSWDVHSSFRWSVGSFRWSADSTISKEALQSGYQFLNFTSYPSER